MELLSFVATIERHVSQRLEIEHPGDRLAGPVGGFAVDKNGALRVVFPRLTLEELIANTFEVMRRNAGGNHLVLVAMAKALSALADRLDGAACDAAMREAAAAKEAAQTA